MGDIAEFAQRVMALQELNGSIVKDLARTAGAFPDQVDLVFDILTRKIKGSVGRAKLASWYLLDAAMKTTVTGRSAIAPRVQQDLFALATEDIPWATLDADGTKKYMRLLETWRKVFGDEEVTQIVEFAKHAQRGAADAGGQVPQAAAAGGAAAAGASMPEPPRVSGDAPEPPRVREGETPGMAPQVGGARDPESGEPMRKVARTMGAARRSTRSDAPANPELVAPATLPTMGDMNRPMPMPGAPAGYMKAPNPEATESYLIRRRGGLRALLERNKRKREEGDQADDEREKEMEKTDPRRFMKRRLAGLLVKSRWVAPAVDESNWPTMPETFPRDPETNVQIGNYVDGVIFIRDAIREAGGALELNRLNEKIPEIKSLANRIKSVRDFIEIHMPTTFVVTLEEGRRIVRLSENPAPQPGETPSWIETPCPECGKVVPGHNLPKHRNSKRCILTQMMLGKEGKATSVISQISALSYRILRNVDASEDGDPGVDDDDLECFASLIHKAGAQFRTKHSSKGDWRHVWRAIQAVHGWWLFDKDCEQSADVELTVDDKSMVKFLATVGSNLYRLPISYIDFGDWYSMCGPFIEEACLPPAPRPAKFGATNIVPKECACPGLVFTDPGLDSDNPRDSDRESDDDYTKEADTAAPLAMSQVLSFIGTDAAKDKKKLMQVAAQSIEWRQSNPITQMKDAATAAQIAGPAPAAAGAPPKQEYTFNAAAPPPQWAGAPPTAPTAAMPPVVMQPSPLPGLPGAFQPPPGVFPGGPPPAGVVLPGVPPPVPMAPGFAPPAAPQPQPQAPQDTQYF